MVGGATDGQTRLRLARALAVIVLFLGLHAVCFGSAARLLSAEELDACIAKMRALPAERRYNGLGEAWNALSARERHGVLAAVADIEKQDVTPEELRALARMDDEVHKPGLVDACTADALVTSTRAVWGALTRGEKELVYHELHTAL